MPDLGAPLTDPLLPSKVALVHRILREIPNEVPSDTTAVLTQTMCLSKDMTGEESLNRLPLLLLQRRSLEALIVCDNTLRDIVGHQVRSTLRPLIVELQQLLQRELRTTRDIDLIDENGRVHLLPRRSLLIGRPSTERDVDIAVNCMWFSRGDRQLALSCKGPAWLIEDLGSTNGSFVHGEPLKTGRHMSLPFGETCVAIGTTENGHAPVTVHFYRPAIDPGAVVITLSATPLTEDQAAKAWPSMRTDIGRRWIVFREQVGISADEDSAIRIKSAKQGILAAIRYQSGFWLAPAQHCDLRVDDMAVFGSLPMVPGTTMSLAGCALRVAQTASEQREGAAPLLQMKDAVL